MSTIGYAYANGDHHHLSEQLTELGEFGYERLVVESPKIKAGKIEQLELMLLVSELKEGDRIVIYDLRTLGKSLIQLSEFLDVLEEKNIGLWIVSEGMQGEDLNAKEFRNSIQTLARLEKELIRTRTMKGLAEARSEGRIGGRPRINQEIAERVRFLHQNKKTLREIAEECHISLGTAYKYSQA